jgi:hypothetical protein
MKENEYKCRETWMDGWAGGWVGDWMDGYKIDRYTGR